jgi:hypothetical protein
MRSCTSHQLRMRRSASDVETEKRLRSPATGKYSSGGRTGKRLVLPAAIGTGWPRIRRLAKERPTTEPKETVPEARDPIRPNDELGRPLGRPHVEKLNRRRASRPRRC